jgi:hypothetical protein
MRGSTSHLVSPPTSADDRGASRVSHSLQVTADFSLFLTRLLLLLLSPEMLDMLYLILTRLMLFMRSLKILKENRFGFWCHLLLTAIPSVPNGFSKTKQSEDGLVVINKVRLVAQGFCQKEGINYEETFTPVARL